MATLQKVDPFKPPRCRWNEDDQCIVRQEDDCMGASKGYTIHCKKCEEDVETQDDGGHYRGQTGRSLHARAQEHTNGLKVAPKYVLW